MDNQAPTDKFLFYSSLSKFKLVEMLKQRQGEAKYAFNRTKPELIRILCELDMQDTKPCKYCNRPASITV